LAALKLSLHPPAISAIKAIFFGPKLANGDRISHEFQALCAEEGRGLYESEATRAFQENTQSTEDELSQDIDRTVHTMQDEATVFADPNDRASQESDMALELRNRDRERKLIKKIDETIAKIDAGEYGYCESCGIEIGLKRLEARPPPPSASTARP